MSPELGRRPNLAAFAALSRSGFRAGAKARIAGTGSLRDHTQLPESGEARFGGVTGTLALEQFPRLLPGRGRSGKNE